MNEEEKIEKIRNILHNSPPTKHEVKKISKMALRLSKDHPSSKSSVDFILQLLKLFPKEKKIQESLRELEHPKRLKGIHYLVCKGYTSLERWMNTIAEEWKYLDENEALLNKLIEVAKSEGHKERLKQKIQKNKNQEVESNIRVYWDKISSQTDSDTNTEEDSDFEVRI